MKLNKKILVTGDYVIDHHLLKGNKSDASSTENLGTSFLSTYGGAKLTYDLLSIYCKSINNDITCVWPFKEMPEIGTSQGTTRDSYIRWDVTENDKKEQDCTFKEKLGFGGHKGEKVEDYFIIEDTHKNEKFDSIVVDEAGIGYRNYRETWPNFANAGKIILKTTYPLCEGILWDELMNHRQQLTVVVNLNQIKHYNVKVSNNISWEQTALDIVYGLKKNKTLVNLLKAANIVVTIGSAGAVIINTNDNPDAFEYTLVFDPENMENEWEDKNKEIKNFIGLGSSFLTGFVGADKKDITDNVKVGLNTMNAAMLHGVFKMQNNKFEVSDLSDAFTNRFKKRYYSSAFIPSPIWKEDITYLHNSDWSILENNYDNYKDGYEQKSDLYPLAFDLAQDGVNSFHYAPRLTLGKISVFDRNEIENLRNIRTQVDFYDKTKNPKKPLNITVFGPPGAGKSFIVKALANAMFEGKSTKPDFHTFNLSQFKDETELPGAFHAIRDSVLKGKLPIVFWDEFDSGDYRWLKCLIAPMQDGEFQEGKEIHPIGKAIFVFAGGMTYTMQHFAEKMEEPEFISKKGPDFLSRISCSLNVFGPNRKPYYDEVAKEWKKYGEKKDICFSIRRALFIRSILGSEDKKLNIEPNLLRTLIEVNTYKSGSRGLERLLRSLAAVDNNKKIELSDLPSKEVIQMNVDYSDFMDKLSDDSMDEKVVFEKMAISIHNAWLEKEVTYSVYYKQFEDLSYDARLDNVSAAMRMGKVIEKSGEFKLISQSELKSKMLRDATVDFNEFLLDERNLELLAEEEHNGWMYTRELTNWKPGVRSDYHKLHNCLVPYDELDKGITENELQKEKNKDRDTIKKYTKMVDGSGFTITKK